MEHVPFEEYYRDALEELGLADRDSGIAGGLPEEIPDALRAWYRLAGRSWLNTAHNRVLGPDALRRVDDKIVFAEENQDVVVWGFDAVRTVDDPEVWQAEATGVDHPLTWHSEGAPLSRFLIDMFRHTVAGDAPTA